MKFRLRRFAWLTALVLFAVTLTPGCMRWFKRQPPPLPPRMQVSEGTIGPGDEIAVSVYKHQDLNFVYSVPETGTIFVPLAGEINVAGIKATEVRGVITKALDQYIVDPQVRTDVRFDPRAKVTVLGEVRSPGMYGFSDRTAEPSIITQIPDPAVYGLPQRSAHTVIDAIGMSGGFLRSANRDKVILIRETAEGPRRFVLDLKRALKKGEMRYNPEIVEGDIIFVPTNLVSDLDRLAAHLVTWLSPILQVEQGILLGYDVSDAIQGEEDFRTRSDINIDVSP